MPCYYPLAGWRSRTVNPATGKRPVVFQKADGLIDRPVEVPCGKCTGCRLERARQWAIRCMHEKSLYSESSFLTLTYSDDNLPAFQSLQLEDYQTFFKRLRKKTGPGLRFFGCGEYGETRGRPHYHAILFNYNFPDRRHYKTTDSGVLFRSAILDRTWGHGLCSIGTVTFESCAYVAKYCVKKVNGDKAAAHYRGRLPEFSTQSKGIGRGWYEKYKSDVDMNDSVVMRGREMKPPQYYDRLREREVEPGRWSDPVRAARARAAEKVGSTKLRVKETVAEARLSLKKGKI